MFSKQVGCVLSYLIFFNSILLPNFVHANDYTSCLAEKLQGITHDLAVKAIIEACRVQHPSEAPIESKPLIDGRYRDNSNGTVTDILTNLTWMRCSLGQHWTGSACSGEAMGMHWSDALRAANSFSYANYEDWRVPTIEELDTIVFCSNNLRKPSIRPNGSFDKETNGECYWTNQNRPTINHSAFPNTPEVWFWSSSSYVGDPYHAWYIYFNNGQAHYYPKEFNIIHVRLVRTVK